MLHEHRIVAEHALHLHVERARGSVPCLVALGVRGERIVAEHRLGIADGERFRVLAQRAGVVGAPDRSGRLWFSEADVERVRSFRLRTSWERVLDDDKDE